MTMKERLKAWWKGAVQRLRETLHSWRASVSALVRWMSRVTDDVMHEKQHSNIDLPGSRKSASDPKRPAQGVYFIPTLWRGPADEVPEGVRKTGIDLKRYGIDPGNVATYQVYTNAVYPPTHDVRRGAASDTSPAEGGDDASIADLRATLAHVEARVTSLERSRDATNWPPRSVGETPDPGDAPGTSTNKE